MATLGGARLILLVSWLNGEHPTFNRPPADIILGEGSGETGSRRYRWNLQIKLRWVAWLIISPHWD